MNLILELLTILILVLFLIKINPIITIFILLIMSLAGYCVYVLWREKIYDWGKDAQYIEANLNKKITDNTFSIKEIIIYGKQNFFLNSLVNQIVRYSKIIFKIEIVQQLPRIIVEILVAFIILTLIYYLTYKNISSEELIVTLSAFSIIAIRLMPSISRILTYIQKIKYFHPSLEILFDELNSTKLINKHLTKNNIEFNFNSIEIKDLNFSYNKNKFVFENNINLKIFKGQFIGIHGTSGSGKSTLVNLVTGLIKPSKGFIYSENQNIHNYLEDWQKQIAYVPQNINLLDDNIEKNIAFGEDQKILLKKRLLSMQEMHIFMII